VTVQSGVELDPKPALESQVESIRQCVDWVNADVAAFGPRLLSAATAAAQARHDKVVRDKEVADSFGLPQK
jgi:hypothetical protein